MKNSKTKRIILILLAIILLLSSCTSKVIDTDKMNIPEQSALIPANNNDEGNSPVSQLDPRYEKIRFGETQDILLLDVEWHTPESYEEMWLERELENYESIDEIDDWTLEAISNSKKDIENEELYMVKTINGKKYDMMSFNPYNNKWSWDKSDTSQIDPDGYYIYNIYPFRYGVWYLDENDIQQWKDFSAENEKEFCLIADDLISYCDELLTDGKITQEEYNKFAIKSPLDCYVRVMGWFGEDDLKNYPLKEYTFPPTPKLIKDKNDFSVLFIGNSLTYSGSLPNQIKKLSEMYGITVEHTSITPGGAILNDTKEQAIQKIQENKYDYVIFHDGGTFPVDNTADFLSNVELLCEEARKSGAIPVLFNPAWANVDKKPAKESQNALTAAYEKAAKIHGAILVNAGEAWVYAYDKHPDLKLYADDVHANNAGAYLTACVFVSTLFDLHIKDIAEDNTYHGDDAIRLGQAAWEYVQYYNEYKQSPTEIITIPDGTNEKIELVE